MSEHRGRGELFALPLRLYGVLRRWLGEDGFRLRFVNIGYLFSGNVVAALLGLVSFGLAARTLGPELFGILALLSAYTRFVEKLMTFQSWQALIRFGSEALERGELRLFKGVLRFGLLLDLTTATLGTLLAVAFALLASDWFGWSGEIEMLLVLYCTVLLFRLQSVPVTVLRLFGRFRFFAFEQVFNASLRVTLVTVGFYAEQGLWYFAAIWYLMQPLTTSVLMCVAWLELRRRDLLKLRAASVRDITAQFKGIWNFAWSTNLSITLQASTMELDTLLVGAFTDASSAGLYHVAKRIGRMLMEVGVQAQAVLYPEVMRLWLQGEIKAFGHALRQTLSVLGGLCMVIFVGIILVFFFAEPLIAAVAGVRFAAAADLLIVQVVAASFYLIALGLRPALLSTGYERELLMTIFWSAVLFQITALALLPLLGPIGGNIAHLVSGVTWLIAMLWYVRRALGGARPAPRGPLKTVRVDDSSLQL